MKVLTSILNQNGITNLLRLKQNKKEAKRERNESEDSRDFRDYGEPGDSGYSEDSGESGHSPYANTLSVQVYDAGSDGSGTASKLSININNDTSTSITGNTGDCFFTPVCRPSLCDFGKNANYPVPNCTYKGTFSQTQGCFKSNITTNVLYQPSTNQIWKSKDFHQDKNTRGYENIISYIYYSQAEWFLDQWKFPKDRTYPTSCFCSKPEPIEIHLNTSFNIDAGASTFPDQYYYENFTETGETGETTTKTYESFYMAYDGSYFNVFFSNGSVYATNESSTTPIGNYDLNITIPSGSTSSPPATYNMTPSST